MPLIRFAGEVEIDRRLWSAHMKIDDVSGLRGQARIGRG